MLDKVAGNCSYSAEWYVKGGGVKRKEKRAEA